MTSKTYGVVGLGMMGGSFAQALRERVLCPAASGAAGSGTAADSGGACAAAGRGRIFALDRDASVLQEALEKGVIDRGFPPESTAEMLSLCDVVFVCLYPAAAIGFLKARKDDFKAGSIVTDISGVKGALAEALPEILGSAFDFIPGHPMAGSEKEGYGHASGNVFQGRNYILMPLPSNKPENLGFFKTLVTALGFGRIIETDPATHDSKIAFTSQLCHIIASALVDSAEDTRVTSFGGGSFEDLTRIAMINAPLWTELFFANKTALLERIIAFEESLGAIKVMLERGEEEALLCRLQAVREKRTAMAG